jgi:hypothetical protein
MARFNANQSQNQSYVCSIGVFLRFENKGKVYIVFTHRRESFESTGSIRHAIALLRWGYLDYAFSQPRVFDYVFSRPRMDARRFQNDFEERRSPMLNRVADAVDEGMKAGRLRKDGRCRRLRCGPGDPNNR